MDADKPLAVTLTDENISALFTAFYGEQEGQQRMKDARQHGAAAALRMAEKRAAHPAQTKRK